MDYPLYNQKAENIGNVDLPEVVFGVDPNDSLIYQVVTSQLSNRRQVLAHAKTRAEVRGGGKKPWRQKGTGRARHGSSRSPIWAGGGVTFGPTKDINFKRKINKKMAKKALVSVLSYKAKDKNLIIVDNISLDNWKTKELAKILKGLSQLFPNKGKSGFIIVTGDNASETIRRCTKNIPNIDIVEARNLNALMAISKKNILLLESSVGILENLMNNKTKQ